jgi:hypothetical protein
MYPRFDWRLKISFLKSRSGLKRTIFYVAGLKIVLSLIAIFTLILGKKGAARGTWFLLAFIRHHLFLHAAQENKPLVVSG